MTGPRSSGSYLPPLGSVAHHTPGSGPSVGVGEDAFIRRAGKGLILAFHAALKAIRLYPLENAAVQNAAEELRSLTKELVDREHELEMRVSGEFVFINTVRLRLDLDNYASFSHLLSVFRAAGIGSLHLHRAPTLQEWQRFLAFLNVPSSEPPDARFESLHEFPFTPQYLQIALGDGTTARLHYVDEGPRRSDAVLLLHGEASWSFLYRKTIAALPHAVRGQRPLHHRRGARLSAARVWCAGSAASHVRRRWAFSPRGCAGRIRAGGARFRSLMS